MTILHRLVNLANRILHRYDPPDIVTNTRRPHQETSRMTTKPAPPATVPTLLADIYWRCLRFEMQKEIYTNHMLLLEAQALRQDADKLVGLIEARLCNQHPTTAPTRSDAPDSISSMAPGTSCAEPPTPTRSLSPATSPGTPSPPGGAALPATDSTPSTSLPAATD